MRIGSRRPWGSGTRRGVEETSASSFQAVVLDAPVSLREGAHVRVTLHFRWTAPVRSRPTFAAKVRVGTIRPKPRAWLEWFDALEPILTEREFQELEEQRVRRNERQKNLTARESERIAAILT